MKLSGAYPAKPLSAIPALLLEAFLAEEALERDDDLAAKLDDISTQRIYATYQGARERAASCGGLAGHDGQAAALLIAIDELDSFLKGGLTIGGRSEVLAKLDRDELRPLHDVHETMIRLLDWHFKNGAGALLPIAKYFGLASDSAQAVPA